MNRMWRALCASAAAFMTAGALVAAGSAGPANAASSSSAPVNVGLVGGFTGPLASSVIAFRPALEAWADYVNANGGVNGHHVNLIVKDDMTDLTTAVSDVHTLISQNHVVALFDVSNFDLQWGSFAASQNVPVIPDASSVASITNPNFFTPGQTTDSLPESVAQAAKKVGAKKLALFYCAESADCTELVAPIRTAAKSVSVPLVYSTSISATAPNYTAECLSAKQAGADALFVGDAVSVLLTVAKDCQQQGYNPTLIGDDGAVAPSFASAPGWRNGMISMQPNIPFFVNNTSATKTMFNAFNKYQPGFVHNPDFNELAVEGWAAGLLFQQAAKAGNLGAGGSITSTQIYDGLYAAQTQGTTLNGVSPPLHYTKGQPHLTHCWFWMRTNNGKFTTPYGLSPVCAAVSGAV